MGVQALLPLISKQNYSTSLRGLQVYECYLNRLHREKFLNGLSRLVIGAVSISLFFSTAGVLLTTWLNRLLLPVCAKEKCRNRQAKLLLEER